MTLNQAILATLSYHDIFNYPLTAIEINKYLIRKKSAQKNIEKALKNLQNLNKIGFRGNHYHLIGRGSTVKIRNTRKAHSRKKFKKALFFAQILKLIPSVKLVALTGALAMENSSYSDDIDLLIVTSKNKLWTTRLFATFALLFYKRNPNNSKKNNKACLNIFLDESSLTIKEKNLYTAHEVIQMYLLWDKDNSYIKFLKANAWINKYLPNWKPQRESSELKKVNRKAKNSKIHLPLKINYSLVENLLKNIQLAYMKSKITTEKIGERQLFFHPKATEAEILAKYNHKLKKLKIKETIDNN